MVKNNDNIINFSGIFINPLLYRLQNLKNLSRGIVAVTLF